MLLSILPSSHARARQRAIAFTAVLLASAWLAVPALAARPPVRIEESWSDSKLASREIRSVAVLPAVTGEGYNPYHVLSDELANALRNDGRRWLTPLASYQGLGDNEPERLKAFRTIVSEVRDAGRTRKTTTTRIAERLGVDAIVLIRVDRWERIADASDVTNVDAHAEMVLADGTPAWRIAGKSSVASTSYRPRGEMPKPSSGNKLLEAVLSPGSGNSGGSTSGGGGGGSPSAGSANTGGTSGGSGSGSGGTSAPPPPPVQKFDQESIRPAEDILRLRDPGQPDDSRDTFRRAAEQLVAEWAAKRPAGFAAVKADSTGAGATR